MTAGLVRHWLETGRLELPLPASGRTAERWQRLARLAEEDIVAARIAEAHADAVAILHELGGKPPDSDQLWGVWAAESSDDALIATSIRGGAIILNGTKVWCSGAGFCTHALVTARLDDGRCGLFAVPVTEPAVKALPTTWWNVGMAAGDAILTTAAAQIDSDPFDRSNTAQLLARRARTVVEHAVDEAITRTGRALGPGPLCQDGRHAQRVADLTIYIRQSHAERDLAELGRLAGRQPVSR